MKSIEIREKRLELGLTQEELATKLGMSARSIINYEKGGVIPKTKNEMLEEFFNNSKKNNESLEDIIYNRIEDKFKERLDLIEQTQQLLQEDFVRVFKIVMNKDKTLSTEKQHRLTRKES